jgi:hypothetical protein
VTPHIFISHADADQEVARIVATTLSRISLQQIKVWYSSDTSATGGIAPGEVWTQALLKRLEEGSTLIAIVTPNSFEKPWLHFETGYVAGRRETEIIPVCVGLKSTEIPFPLAMYQLYELGSLRHLSALAEKLMARFALHYDAELVKPVLADAVSRLGALRFDAAKREQDSSPLEDVKALFERRFVELAGMFAGQRDGAPRGAPWYNLTVQVRFRVGEKPVIVLVQPETNVQEVLNELYHQIAPWVKAWTYLQDWVLVRVDGARRRPLIVRGLTDEFPATNIFVAGTVWEAVQLVTPYHAGQPLETLHGQVLEHEWG